MGTFAQKSSCEKWLALTLLAFGCGCSSNDGLVPVEGKVLYKGKEIHGAVVTFHPADGDAMTDARPVGMTNEAGTFTLATGQKPGAHPGKYLVTFIWPKEVAAAKKKKAVTMETGNESKDFFDGAYTDPKKSKYKIEIKKGETKLDSFRLD